MEENINKDVALGFRDSDNMNCCTHCLEFGDLEDLEDLEERIITVQMAEEAVKKNTFISCARCGNTIWHWMDVNPDFVSLNLENN